MKFKKRVLKIPQEVLLPKFHPGQLNPLICLRRRIPIPKFEHWEECFHTRDEVQVASQEWSIDICIAWNSHIASLSKKLPL